MPSSPKLQPLKRGTAYVGIGDGPFRHRIEAALRSLNVGVRHVTKVDEVPSVSHEKTDRVLLVGGSTHRSLSMFDGIAELREVDGVTPVLFCAGGVHPDLLFLPSFVRSGIDEMVLAVFDDFESELSTLVRRSLDYALPQSLLEAVLPGRRKEVRGEQAWITRRAYRRVHVDEVADWLKIAQSTLRDRHGRDGGPSPHRWYQLSRLLHVAHQLDGTNADLSTIARRLDFPSELDMSVFVRRMTGLSPTALRVAGATRHTLRLATSKLPS